MTLQVKKLSEEERKKLTWYMEHPVADYPVKPLQIVLQSADGVSVKDIAKNVGLHPINVRKWINRYVREGITSLRLRKSTGRPALFSAATRARIVEIYKQSPTAYGLEYSRWTLRNLRDYLVGEGIVNQISFETIRFIVSRK